MTTLVRDTVKLPTDNAATSEVANEAEVFTFTPTKGMDKIIIEIDVADSHGTVACSLGAGGQFWASGAKTFNAVQNKTSIFHISDIARFAKEVVPTAEAPEVGDIVELTLTPANGKILLTNHAAVVRIIELP